MQPLHLLSLSTASLICLTGLHQIHYMGLLVFSSSLHAVNMARSEYITSITTTGTIGFELILRYQRSIHPTRLLIHPSTLENVEHHYRRHILLRSSPCIHTSSLPLDQTAKSFPHTTPLFTPQSHFFPFSFSTSSLPMWCANKSLGGASERFSEFTICVWILEGVWRVFKVLHLPSLFYFLHIFPHNESSCTSFLKISFLTTNRRPQSTAAYIFSSWYMVLPIVEYLFLATNLVSLLCICNLTVTIGAILWRVFHLCYNSSSTLSRTVQAWYCEAVIENFIETLSIDGRVIRKRHFLSSSPFVLSVPNNWTSKTDQRNDAESELTN